MKGTQNTLRGDHLLIQLECEPQTPVATDLTAHVAADCKNMFR